MLRVVEETAEIETATVIVIGIVDDEMTTMVIGDVAEMTMIEMIVVEAGRHRKDVMVGEVDLMTTTTEIGGDRGTTMTVGVDPDLGAMVDQTGIG